MTAPTFCTSCGGLLAHWTVKDVEVNWCDHCDLRRCPSCDQPVPPRMTSHCGKSMRLG